MRKINYFFIVLIVSLGVLVILLGVNLYLSALNNSYNNTWMSQMWQQTGGMMGGMMGGGINQPTTPTTAPSFLWAIPVTLIGITLIGITGVVYFFALPEIKTTPQTEENPTVTVTKIAAKPSNGTSTTPYESVLKTATAEERRILEVLSSHEGKYLQKYIRKEAGLSRLKTHRILARLSERGIVILTQSGNTNEVVLADWLKLA
jgi:uncharacterized membrane protein